MAVTSSAPISLSDIASEFVVSAPYSLTDFYRGGSNVSDTSENAGIPTSGAISITDFYGATKLSAAGESITENHAAASWNSIVGIKFDADGNVYENSAQSTSWVQIDTGSDWIRPVSAASSGYEVRYTGKSGVGTFNLSEAAAEDTWISLGVDRIWQMTKTTVGSIALACTFELRTGSSGAAESSGSYTFTINNTV